MSDLTYRNTVPEDFDALHALASDHATVRQLGRWPWPPDPAFTARRARPCTGRGFVWTVLEQDQFAGSIAITQSPRSGRATLGYWFTPDARGRGIATRAGHAAIRHAFSSDPDLHEIEAAVWADNAPSVRVLGRLGFTHWQTLYEHALVRGLPTLSLIFHWAAADWAAADWAAGTGAAATRL